MATHTKRQIGWSTQAVTSGRHSSRFDVETEMRSVDGAPKGTGSLNPRRRGRQVELSEFQRVAAGVIFALNMGRHREFARGRMQRRVHIQSESNLSRL